ncbi:hypothetical protein GJ496_001343 [Pomphorhynchus laevis]|nr:hypothetical protein GJ496_001343 [Pomphorhynchus laevis]
MLTTKSQWQHHRCFGYKNIIFEQLLIKKYFSISNFDNSINMQKLTFFLVYIVSTLASVPPLHIRNANLPPAHHSDTLNRSKRYEASVHFGFGIKANRGRKFKDMRPLYTVEGEDYSNRPHNVYHGNQYINCKQQYCNGQNDYEQSGSRYRQNEYQRQEEPPRQQEIQEQDYDRSPPDVEVEDAPIQEHHHTHYHHHSGVVPVKCRLLDTNSQCVNYKTLCYQKTVKTMCPLTCNTKPACQ